MGHWPSTQPCFDWQNVCTSGESNSGLVRGKDLCYHYTTSAINDTFPIFV